MVGSGVLRSETEPKGPNPLMSTGTKRAIRCAIYTRKSSEEGLEQSFNSLDAQREACEAYILSQRQEGWRFIGTPYDDGGYLPILDRQNGRR